MSRKIPPICGTSSVYRPSYPKSPHHRFQGATWPQWFSFGEIHPGFEWIGAKTGDNSQCIWVTSWRGICSRRGSITDEYYRPGYEARNLARRISKLVWVCGSISSIKEDFDFPGRRIRLWYSLGSRFIVRRTTTHENDNLVIYGGYWFISAYTWDSKSPRR